ncbi:MAG: phosphoribosylanthranilate isomerase [Bryobacterales bacterium]|jgi:phosphoribosylanthranilate isomerase|nr:phosphoribosylanthranilate isomerase [Bryobacterales bacterium]
MPTLVKICGITNLPDALVSVEAGADALGFNFFADSPRYVRPEVAAEIVRALPPTVRTVGVFVNASPAEVDVIRAQVGLDVVQLHGSENPAHYQGPATLWRAVRVEAGFQPSHLPHWPVEAVLLDGPAGALYGGAGIPFDWQAARALPMPVIIAGGLHPLNVADALRQAQPWGVDACSRLESSPGIKDHMRIRAFLDAVRAAETNLPLSGRA